MSEQEGLLAEQLKEHFGLTGDPFSPLNKVFYEGGQRLHNLETMRHLSIFGDMILVLTGEKGAGKSSLIDAFTAKYGSELDILHVSAARLKDPNSVLLTFARQLDLPLQDGFSREQLLQSLIKTSEKRGEALGRRVLWVVDDAEVVSKEDLVLLVELFKLLPPESSVALLLAGMPSLLENMNLTEGDHEEWLHQIHVKPFSGSETTEYLTLRLKSAGYPADLELSEAQVTQLSEVGKGLPGRSNRVFGSIVLGFGSFAPVSQAKKSNMAQKVLFGLAGILLFSFLFVSYQYGVFDSASNEASDIASVESEEEKRLLELEQQARIAMLDLAISKSSSDGVALDAIVEQEVDVDSPSDLASVDENAADYERLNANESNDDKESSSIEVSKGLEIDSSKKLIDVEKEGALAKQDVSDLSPAKPVVENSIPVAEVSKYVANKSRFYRSGEWMKSQGDGGYTYQVLGSYNEQTAVSFTERSKNDDLYYVESRYKGKQWFIVLYGRFSAKDSARKGLTSAPNFVQKEKPWLRSLQGVVDSLPPT